jgi:lipoprotein NlpD
LQQQPPATAAAIAPERATAPAASTPPALPPKTESGRVPEIDDDSLGWIWPATGKIVAGFSESANLKGIDIAGKAGQPVVASAAGRVVYAGSGLRGYGKLIIVKHNNTFLSAYAHNREIAVKEGQQVAKGQKIAEMGDTDADQVKLHFEIRRLGKPVDPAKFLPPG